MLANLPEIIKQFRPTLLSQARGRVADARCAEEAVADAFIALCSRKGDPLPEAAVLPWLRVVTSRRCVDRLRQHYRAALFPTEAEPLSRLIESSQDHAVPQYCLESYPRELQLWLAGYSAREAAALVGMSRSGYSRRLKKQFTEYATNNFPL